MAILASDIKLVASQVMGDVPEGGGAPTSIVIFDGQSNAVFPDISELDRAGGRVNLRKVHISVQTPDTDTYLGANIIVSEPPTDPNVSVTLFSTKATFDRRTDAKSRIESYLTRGPSWPAVLFENHLAGQRSIQLFQRPSIELPPVGHTMVLISNEGKVNELEQYIRVTRVTTTSRTFQDDNDSEKYAATIVTCEISDALRYAFEGSPPNKYFKRIGTGSLVRDTTVADAGVYVGVVPLVEPATLGALTVKAKSIFTQLVPNAQTEIAITDMKPNSDLAVYTAAGPSYTVNTSLTLSLTSKIVLGQNVLPGSLRIVSGGVTLTDLGGRLMSGATQVGLIDYDQGVLTISDAANIYAGAKTISYIPASVSVRALNTASFQVTQASRSTTLVTILSTPPTPGSMSVSYMAQGRWYTLRDSGGGQLAGTDATFGTGTVSYTTGSVSLTLGALPDVGSTILLNYGLPSTDARRDGPALKLQTKIQLANAGVAPNSVTVGWTLHVVTAGVTSVVSKSSTDNGQGLMVGDATGKISYVDGTITLEPKLIPTTGVEFTVQYGWGVPFVETFAAPERHPDNSITLPLVHPNIMPRTLRVEFNTVYDPDDLPLAGTISHVETGTTQAVTASRPWRPRTDPIVTVVDNGTGAFTTRPETEAVINYAAGTVTFKPQVLISVPHTSYAPVKIGTSSYTTTSERIDIALSTIDTITTTHNLDTMQVQFKAFETDVIGAVMPSDLTGYAKVTYRTTAAGSTATEIFLFAPQIDLTEGNRDPIIPGSVSFTLGTQRYVDRQGKLYTNIDYTTGSGQQVGTVNYSLGVCNLTLLSEGIANAGTVTGLGVTIALLPVTEIKFRTAASPIRPGGFVVQFIVASDRGQAVRTLTADANGFISAADVKGEIDYLTGVCSLRFGAMVPAAGNEREVWYDAAYVGSTGLIWRPNSVISDTIRYASSAYTYLPLDAEILGLDPVRLPQDGRVPIFRTGGFAVLGNSMSETLTVTNGMVVNCNRVRLSRVRVVGFDKAVITTGYTANLEAGTITFNNVAGYSQPVKVENRIEDMVQVSDIQINGQLGFTRQITHNYPVPGSYISSALVAQDLKARVSIFFDQAIWNGITWSDAVIGDVATATYNDALAPLVVTNSGAVTERWAIRFTSNSTFQVIGEHVGVILTGNINSVTAPINPATNSPYFTIPILGWGSGWASGNLIRFNTVGAMFPVWVVRTIRQGVESVQDDSFTLLVRGDVDRP